MSKLVSILIPAYNAESWLGEAIESALGQTWPVTEIIVVNDGSRDSTLQVARQYESKNVRVLTQANRGASAARNRALREAQGQYIQWLDADDVLDFRKIETQLAIPHNENEVLSSAWGQYYYRRDKAIEVRNDLCRDHTASSWLRTKMISNGWMSPESWLVGRRLTDSVGPWDESLSLDDDGEYFARLVARSVGVRYNDRAKSYHRMVNPQSLSKSTKALRGLDSQLRSMEAQISYLRGLEDNQATREAALIMLQRWYPHYHDSTTELKQRINSMSKALGGELEPPVLRAKYRWLRLLTGSKKAWELQRTLPSVRYTFERNWDRTMAWLGL